jgi:hypothetical protein
MNGEHESPDSKSLLSRNSFLKLGAVGVAAAFAIPYVDKFIGSAGLSNMEKETLSSEKVNGIDIYGLREKITSQEQLDELVDNFNYGFERKLNWALKGKNVWEQREAIMPANKRFVEFVVTESAYRSFEQRRTETGLNYAEWVKASVDLMNRSIKNAKPAVDVSIEIVRIIVVDDKLEQNQVNYSKDVDGIWFDNSDYRVDQKRNIGQGSFWSITHDRNGKLVAQNPAGGSGSYGRQIVLPEESDSLETIREGCWIDFGLPHELSHLLLNLPDEYVFNFEGANSLFVNFIFNTGSFMEPKLSPYLAIQLRDNVKKKIRGYYMDPRGIGKAPDMLSKFNFYGALPDSVKFGVLGAEILEVLKSSSMFPDYYDRKDAKGGTLPSKKMTSIVGAQTGGDSSVLKKTDFASQVVEGQGMYPLLFRVDCIHNNIKKEVYVPIGIFNMSKLSGVSNASYKIEFSDVVPTPELKTQTLNLIDETEIDNFERANKIYAKMKVEGTSTWCVWAFQF